MRLVRLIALTVALLAFLFISLVYLSGTAKQGSPALGFIILYVIIREVGDTLRSRKKDRPEPEDTASRFDLQALPTAKKGRAEQGNTAVPDQANEGISVSGAPSGTAETSPVDSMPSGY